MRISQTFVKVFLLLALATLVASWYIRDSVYELSLEMQIELEQQEQTLFALAELTNQNGADSVAESIIRDCDSSNRLRFEQLLNKLGSLQSAELSEIEKLFDACASFFSERKALMVARLERELEMYLSLVKLFSLVDPDEAYLSYDTENWKQLIDLEKQRRDLLVEQVEIQKTIIAALKTPVKNSDVIETQLVRAQQISELSVDINTQINDIRALLRNI